MARIVGLVFVAGASLTVLAGPSGADGRAVVVDPADGLANEVVRVSWTGFTPTSAGGDNSVIVLQCAQQPVSTADCFTAEPFPAVAEGTRQFGVTGADGSGSALFEVRASAQLPLLGCSASKPCSILVYENDGKPVPEGTLPPSAIVVPVTFAPSQADCPAVETFDIRADGEASAAPLFYRWAAVRCTGDDPLVVDYTETSSNEGRENFLAGLVDLGVTSLEATEEELAAHPEARFSYAPVDLTAVVVVVNMKDPFTGKRLEDIVLTPRLVARLVTDSDVTRFLTDPELRQLNPGVRFPSVALSHPLVRAERNADTRLVTSWIASDAAAGRFLAGQDDFGVRRNPSYAEYAYPQDLFENVAQSAQFLPRAGQNQVALRMFYAVRPTGSTSERTDEIGFLGIVDLPTARRFGLPTARIVNAAGQAVAPTEDAVLAGYREMTATESGVLVNDPAAADPAAYPLVKVDYAMVPADPEDDRREAMGDLLSYAVGQGQDVLPPGYVPLPDDLRDQTRAVVDTLAPPPSTTTTSTTTSTTIPTTLPVDVPLDPEGYVDDGTYDDGVYSEGGAVFDGSGAGGDRAATPASGTRPIDARPIAASREGPAPAPLPTSSSRLVVPLMLAVAGVALFGWSFAGAGSTVQRARASRRERSPR